MGGVGRRPDHVSSSHSRRAPSTCPPPSFEFTTPHMRYFSTRGDPATLSFEEVNHY
jgi:hypothetical protein